MPVCLNYEQIRQFANSGRINLVEILDRNNMCSYLLECKNIISNRMSCYTSKLKSVDYVYAGRDLWQNSENLKTLITKGVISQIASCLWWSEKNIRVLYDQLILLDKKSTDPYLRSFFNGSFCPSSYSCFDNVLGFVVVCMDGSMNDWHEYEDSLPGFCGDVVCLNRDKNICVQDNFCESTIYIVAFGNMKSIYVENKKDPNVYSLKSQGYVFGQKLLLGRHPFIKKMNMF